MRWPEIGMRGGKITLKFWIAQTCPLLLLLSLFSTYPFLPCLAIDAVSRVRAYLLLNDPQGALAELASVCEEEERELSKVRMEALAQAGDERGLLAAWEAYAQAFPEEKLSRPILEAIAWGVIHKGASSSALPTRALAMLAGRVSEDSRGVNLLVQGLRSQSSLMRLMAVRLCKQMRDAKLADEMIRMLDAEPVWAVRLEVIRAAGTMRLKLAKSRLEAMLAAPRVTGEEQAALCEALVELTDQLDRQTLASLVQAPRAAQRMLACELAAGKGLPDCVGLLLPLVDDPHSGVRAAVLQTLGVLRQPGRGMLAPYAKKLLRDSAPQTAISAAWLLLLEEPQEGAAALGRWLNHPIREYRVMAAAAVAAAGVYGLELARESLLCHADPYVKLNLALGLISQRVKVAEATAVLVQALSLEERWMLRQEGIFRLIAPSTVKHQETVPNYPEAINQVTRLQILNLLAMLRHPEAWSSIKCFLQERKWGVSGMAAAVLLTEGDEEAVALVRTLLQDADLRIRTQAALVLSVWGGGEESLAVLEQGYAEADRQMKENILEAVGRIGHMSSIAFLIKGLAEPHQHLRIISAAAILQCINH